METVHCLGVMYDTSGVYEIRYNQHLVVIVYQH